MYFWEDADGRRLIGCHAENIAKCSHCCISSGRKTGGGLRERGARQGTASRLHNMAGQGRQRTKSSNRNWPHMTPSGIVKACHIACASSSHPHGGKSIASDAAAIGRISTNASAFQAFGRSFLTLYHQNGMTIV